VLRLFAFGRFFRPSLLLCLAVGLLSSCDEGEVRLSVGGDGVGRVEHSRGVCEASCGVRGTLVAVPGEHSRFDGWSGGCSGLGSCRPSTDSVTATFTAVDFSVDVSVVGEGTVSLASESFGTTKLWLPRDSTAVLRANPSVGSLFVRWQGDCRPGSEPGVCEVLASRAVAVTAVFEKGIPVRLTVEGPGRVTASAPFGECNSSCSGLAQLNSILTMRPIPAAGSSFVGWMNACSAPADCELTITAPVEVVARFHPNVDIISDGDGRGAVTGLSGCTTLPCSVAWVPGRSLRFQAVPGENSRFVRFEGCASASGSVCTLAQYTPSVRAVFERVVLDATLGDGTSGASGRLVSTGGSEFVWLEAQGPLSLGNSRDTAVVGTGLRRWALFQTRPAPAQLVLSFGAEAEIGSVDAMPDGGMVFVAKALVTRMIGGQLIDSFDEAIVSLRADRSVEWTRVNRGYAHDVTSLRVNQASGQIAYVGGLREGAPAVTVGGTTIQPAQVFGESRMYVATLDRQGQPQWAAQRFIAKFAPDTWPVFALSQGPFVSDVADTTTDDSVCVPMWSPSMQFPRAAAWSFFSPQGACLRSGVDPDNLAGTTGRAHPVEIVAAIDGPDGGVSMLANVPNHTAFWAQRAFFEGYSYAYLPPGGAPIVYPLGSTCMANARIDSMQRFGTNVLMGGQAPCVVGVPGSPQPPGAFLAVFDLTTFRFTSGWHLPRSRLLGAVPINDREVRVLVSFTAPARIGGVDYPLPLAGTERFLLMTVRP
jgi:hypothetical protein